MSTKEDLSRLHTELEALNEAYLAACQHKDFHTCNLLRVIMRQRVTGKSMLFDVGFEPTSKLEDVPS
jgi:hypothetical protein